MVSHHVYSQHRSCLSLSFTDPQLYEACQKPLAHQTIDDCTSPVGSKSVRLWLLWELWESHLLSHWALHSLFKALLLLLCI